MGFYLNTGANKFKLSLKDEIYVDKSDLLGILNKHICTEKRYICLSRPRRFGKSVTANMLCAYYSKGCNSAPLFENLKIAKSTAYKEHLNAYHTIFINMTDEFISASKQVPEMLYSLTSSVIEELKPLCPQVNFPRQVNLVKALMTAYHCTGIPFVIVIDEWDCIMREKTDDEEGLKLYLDFLKLILKDKEYVALCYLTGILPIKKYGSHSALNMFIEYSMTKPKQYAEYFGFTETEVQRLCSQYNVDFKLMQQWYDGYSFAECPHLYNPNSVVRAILDQDFSSYWTQTETFEALRKYIDLNLDGLKDEVVKLVSGQSVAVNTATFHNDMNTFESKDDVLTLLIHLGYLALVPGGINTLGNDDEALSVHIPNLEIRKEFRTCLKNNHQYQGIYELIQKTEELLDNILNLRAYEVAAFFDRAHREHTSILKYNDENSLSCVVALSLLLTSTNTYTVYREQPAGKGYADLIYLPKKGVHKPALLIELKYNQTAQSALSQIKDQHYPEGLRDYHGELILVGLNYSPKTKDHQCLMERITK